MRKRREIKKETIITFYVLVIVLPCLILGFLAFRGIKNDQALVEREQRNILSGFGRDIIHQIDDDLTSIENDYEKIFEDSMLILFIKQHQDIYGIFFVSGEGTPKLLNDGLLYVPDKLFSRIHQTELNARHHLLDKGWQFEFKERNYGRALEYYQSILPTIREDPFGGEVLNAIARVQKYLKINNEAIKTYNQIWTTYPDVYIQGRIPLGTTALMEKSNLYFKNSDSISALLNIRRLLSHIKYSKWQIGSSYYRILMSQAENIVTQCKNSDNEEIKVLVKIIMGIGDSIYSLQTRTEYLLSFIEHIQTELPMFNQTHDGTFQRQTLRIYGNSYFCSISGSDNMQKWGLLFDPDHLIKNNIQSYILDKAKKTGFYWEILDENGMVILRSDYVPEKGLPVLAALPSNLPDISLKLYPENSGLMVSMFDSGEGIFLYIFIVIVIILVFGLLFTLRTINNEIHFSRMKSYFMTTVSHEFKSPLTSIRQMAEMLVLGRVPSTERKKRYFNMILAQSERLSHLIENILDFSKMEEDKKVFHFQKGNIVSLVKDAISSFKHNAADQEFDIMITNGSSIPEIVFDREAMEQVMHNLLDNACKYSDDSKIIEVGIEINGRDVAIYVKDFGIGISKKDKDKIFDRFYRAGDEYTQSVKGSGIGLAIVKKIVEAHKGKVRVKSDPGRGSTFSVILPIT
jgi:signal transduction histidine kinase